MPASGGEPHRLTLEHASIPSPPAWTRDGHSIIFSSTRRNIPTLWEIPVSGGEPVQVPQVGAVALHPSVSPKGNRLAYDQILGSSSIWVVELAEIDGKNSRMQVTASKGYNWAPEFSPDGKKIVFESDRSGTMEIWTCKRDGSGLNQLTNLGGPLYGECSVLMGCFQAVIPMCLACHLKLKRTFVMRLRYSQPEV